MTVIKEIKLRTGKTAPNVLVNTTMIALRHLVIPPEEVKAGDPRTDAEHLNDALTVYELAMAARDSRHVMFGNTGKRAKDLGLVTSLNTDGTAVMHEAIRDIVLAATEVSEFDVSLRNPLMPTDAPVMPTSPPKGPILIRRNKEN